MAYTETSTYEYCTGDELEAYAVRDYGTIDARYTEAVVMAKVSQAEYLVRSATKVTTATDGTKALVLELAKYYMEVQIYSDHPEAVSNAPSPDMFNLIWGKLQRYEEYQPVNSIPTQGINRW